MTTGVRADRDVCALIRVGIQLIGQTQRKLRHSYGVGCTLGRTPTRFKDARLHSRSMKLTVGEGIPGVGFELCIAKKRHQTCERNRIGEELGDQGCAHPRSHTEAALAPQSLAQRHGNSRRARKELFQRVRRMQVQAVAQQRAARAIAVVYEPHC